MEYGRYRILSQLGQGGMAAVYLAEDPLLQRLVAVKVIQTHLSTNSSLIERFTVEAKTAAALRHTNVVEIFDYGLQDSQQYIVMEYIDGQNLQLICSLMQGRPMVNEIAAAILCQAAEGLSSAEKHGVVHRDIKPENLMFNSEGVLKIADFGIAHISDQQSLTQTGAVLGSPNFMSPEQVEGIRPSHKTDLFSLGGVFYYCLTGKMPFTGPSIPATMRNICDNAAPPVLSLNPAADPELVELVDTLLQKQPEARGDGARWMANRLRGYLNSKGIVDLAETAKTFIDSLGVQTNHTMMEAPHVTPSQPPRTGAVPFQHPTGQPSWQTGGRSVLQTQPTTGAMGPSSRSPLVWVGVALVVAIFALAGAVFYSQFLLPGGKEPAPKVAEGMKDDTPAPSRFGDKGEKDSGRSTEAKPGNEAFDSRTSSIPSPVVASAPPKPVYTPPKPVTPVARTKPVRQPAPRVEPKPIPKPVEVTPQPEEDKSTQFAKVLIKSSPPFASVTINGKAAGETPMNRFLDVPAGKVRVEVVHRLHPPFDTTLNLKPGEKRNLKFSLD